MTTFFIFIFICFIEWNKEQSYIYKRLEMNEREKKGGKQISADV